MISDEGTLRAEVALSVRDWRAWSDMDEVVCGVKKEMERRDWKIGPYLYARRKVDASWSCDLKTTS